MSGSEKGSKGVAHAQKQGRTDRASELQAYMNHPCWQCQLSVLLQCGAESPTSPAASAVSAGKSTSCFCLCRLPAGGLVSTWSMRPARLLRYFLNLQQQLHRGSCDA